MMDQLMIGYGVSNTSNPTTTMAYNISPGSNSSSSINQPKKELTLAEKQQLANKLEKENGSLSSATSSSSMKTSKSMTDNFMNKNLVDLTLSSQTKTTTTNNKSNDFDFSEFDSVLTSTAHSKTNQINNNKPNNFNMNSNGLNQFNNSSFNFNNNNNNMSQMHRSTSTQQGFFGNLALPAPPSSNTKVSPIPNIAPPPIKPMQPTINLSSTANSNGANNTNIKKSALDDLNDLFG